MSYHVQIMHSLRELNWGRSLIVRLDFSEMFPGNPRQPIVFIPRHFVVVLDKSGSAKKLNKVHVVSYDDELRMSRMQVGSKQR